MLMKYFLLQKFIFLGESFGISQVCFIIVRDTSLPNKSIFSTTFFINWIALKFRLPEIASY